jgi:MFS transporter, putative metabolite:H+ symporter
MVQEKTTPSNNAIYWLITIAALGYFVDAYDLIVGSVVRATSIVQLGLAQAGSPEIKTIGQMLEYIQSAGILLGGLTFGVLGDKIGRKKALYGSIFIYSVANLLNGFLTNMTPFVFETYCALRFICGFALAAELSVGIVMVSELMKAESRGYGSMIIVSFGILGTVCAAYLFEFVKLPWQTLFIVGGVAGLVLLVLRLSIDDSGIYKTQKVSSIGKGNLLEVFKQKDLLKRFLLSTAIGFPIYFFVSIPIKFAADFGKELGITIKGTIPIMMFYIFLSISDIFANYLSQILKSRKKVIFMYCILCLIGVLTLCYYPPSSDWQYYYVYCPMLGFCAGYWALLITNAAEQVGTNLRSTFATSIPNLVRTLFIPITLVLNYLQPSFGTINSVASIGIGCCIIGLIANLFLEETWGKNLDFVD